MALNIGQVDCMTDQLNTGSFGCAVRMQQILFLILVNKGWSISKLDDFDSDYFNEMVQKKQFTVLPQQVTVEDESEDTVYETFDNGLKMFVRQGIVEYLPTYVGDLCLQKALQSVSGTRKDLLLVDVSGNVYGAETETGFKGFDLNLIQAERQSLPTGAETGKIPLRLQFSALGVAEWTKQANFIKAEDFNITSANGIIDVLLELVDTTTSGEVKVTAKVACDKSTNLDFFDSTDAWQITDSTGVVNITNVTYANGVYTITPDGTGEYSVKLFDSTLGVGVVESEGLFFESNSLNVL